VHAYVRAWVIGVVDVRACLIRLLRESRAQNAGMWGGKCGFYWQQRRRHDGRSVRSLQGAVDAPR